MFLPLEAGFEYFYLFIYFSVARMLALRRDLKDFIGPWTDKIRRILTVYWELNRGKIKKFNIYIYIECA